MLKVQGFSTWLKNVTIGCLYAFFGDGIAIRGVGDDFKFLFFGQGKNFGGAESIVFYQIF